MKLLGMSERKVKMTIEEAYELLLQNINPVPGIDEAKSIIAKDLRERGNKSLQL